MQASTIPAAGLHISSTFGWYLWLRKPIKPEVNMFRKVSFSRWLLGTLLVIAVLAGVGFGAYRIGYAQGMADAPEVAAFFSKTIENGRAFPVLPETRGGAASISPLMWSPMSRGLMPYGGWMRMHAGVRLFGGFLVFLFLTLLFVGLMRLIFRPYWYPAGPGIHGYWHGHPWGAPPWAQTGQEGKTGTDKPADPVQE
jgi:hypothetical protein